MGKLENEQTELAGVFRKLSPEEIFMPMLKSIEEITDKFKEESYLIDKDVATVVYISVMMNKPILVEGPAGVGKTELGKVLATSQGLELIRLQCYEGLDEAKALYEWEYAKQLLYTQILKEKIGEVLADAKTLTEAVDKIGTEEDAFFSKKFILPRPLLKSIMSEKQVVLLIDEIDKADPEFEAFLLEILSDFQVSIPEIGTIKAIHIPQGYPSLMLVTAPRPHMNRLAIKKREMIKSKRHNKKVGVKILPPNGCSSFINRSLSLKPDPDIPEFIKFIMLGSQSV